MAHVPSLLRDDSEVARRGRENGAGTAAAREQQRNSQPLRAGCDRHQAERAEQSGTARFWQEGRGGKVMQAYWTLTDADWSGRSERKLFILIGVPDGI
jgi:hypothetical protein